MAGHDHTGVFIRRTSRFISLQSLPSLFHGALFVVYMAFLRRRFCILRRPCSGRQESGGHRMFRFSVRGGASSNILAVQSTYCLLPAAVPRGIDRVHQVYDHIHPNFSRRLGFGFLLVPS